MNDAAVRLQEHLTARWAADGRTAAPPKVAVLGATTAVTGPQPDRRDANVHLSAASVLIGPIDGACGHCLATRWQRLRTRTERDALETGTAEPTPVGAWPFLTDFHLDAAWQLYQAVSDGVAHLDLRTLNVRTVAIAADPCCPSCGVSEPNDEPPPLELRQRPKPDPDQYRLRSPADYPLPEAALVNPVCGVLGAGTLLTVTSPTTAPASGSVFIRGYGGLLDVSWSGQAAGFAASRRLAYLEGLERYAGTHHRRNREPITAAYHDISDRALHPAECGTYPDAVYETDPLLRRFDPDRPIPWIWGHNLHTGQQILVPRRLCFYSSQAQGDTFVLSSSSGCATGSCLEEAALFGLLELVERDAFLTAWYANLPLTRIDLDSCGTRVQDMVNRAELSGYRLMAFDNRIDLDIPVVTSVAVRRDNGPGMLSFAAAAHLDPYQAVVGALSETLTYIPHQPASVRSRRAELEAMAEDYRLVTRLPDHSALFGLPPMAVHATSYLDEGLTVPLSRARPRRADLRDDLEHVLKTLGDKGFTAILVDQTTPEQEAAGLCTVCTIVPGLVPIDFGWIRQRAPHMPRITDAARQAGTSLRLVPHPFP